jgi:hypothetical protein
LRFSGANSTGKAGLGAILVRREQAPTLPCNGMYKKRFKRGAGRGFPDAPPGAIGSAAVNTCIPLPSFAAQMPPPPRGRPGDIDSRLRGNDMYQVRQVLLSARRGRRADSRLCALELYNHEQASWSAAPTTGRKRRGRRLTVLWALRAFAGLICYRRSNPMRLPVKAMGIKMERFN